jgi:hypothetical protein
MNSYEINGNQIYIDGYTTSINYIDNNRTEDKENYKAVPIKIFTDLKNVVLFSRDGEEYLVPRPNP